MDPSTFATAYGLSTSIGLRPFLTLALASLAMHFGFLHTSHAFGFLGSDGATWLLAGLAVLEFAADKIPVVDHTMHALHFATKPIAAALLVGSAVSGSGSGFDAASGVVMGLGALNALGIHTGVAAVRGASTAMTFGVANPFVSLAEDVVAVFAAVLSILLPMAGAVLAAMLTLVVLLVARHLYLEMRRTRAVVTSG
jgi:hypothetical protein